MGYRRYEPPTPRLFGYDPVRDLPPDHLARLVEEVVEAFVPVPERKGPGQPAYNPRLCIKVLIYGYATGVRSSRKLEELCRESLPYLYLTRGDGPSYRTLCTVRREMGELVEAAWVGLFSVAKEMGIQHIGSIVVDSTRIRADAGSEAIVKREEYGALLAELQRVLEQAEAVDGREEAQERRSQTQTGKPVGREQMRDILRRVRRRVAKSGREEEAQGSEERGEISPRMREKVEAAKAAVEEAMAEGRKHLCLTDPDARMMAEGREKKIRECHTLEVAVDKGSQMLVVGEVTQEAHDNERLIPVVEAAKAHEPEGVRQVDADSGYYQNGAIARLNAGGVDTCVPDATTACDLRRGLPVGTTRGRQQSPIVLTYDSGADCYRCPQGQELHYTQTRTESGQQVRVYVARCDCSACPLSGECLRQEKAKHRTVKVGECQDILQAARQRFAQPEYRERQRRRGVVVETVFGFMRGVLGFDRWQLRGKAGVASEGRLLKTAYQVRKLHRRWQEARCSA